MAAVKTFSAALVAALLAVSSCSPHASRWQRATNAFPAEAPAASPGQGELVIACPGRRWEIRETGEVGQCRGSCSVALPPGRYTVRVHCPTCRLDSHQGARVTVEDRTVVRCTQGSEGLRLAGTVLVVSGGVALAPAGLFYAVMTDAEDRCEADCNPCYRASDCHRDPDPELEKAVVAVAAVGAGCVLMGLAFKGIAEPDFRVPRRARLPPERAISGRSQQDAWGARF